MSMSLVCKDRAGAPSRPTANCLLKVWDEPDLVVGVPRPAIGHDRLGLAEALDREALHGSEVVGRGTGVPHNARTRRPCVRENACGL